MLRLHPLVYLAVFLSCIGSKANRSFSKTTRTQKLPDLYWNTSNPIFRIDNTDHIIDVNQGTLPHEYDQINIICPVYNQTTPKEDSETYVIYNVDKEEFDTCRILNPHPRIVAYCTDPYVARFFTISFRSFSPMPNTLEFIAGQDYYFISTSTKHDIYRRVHGDCRNHNMKVVFKVADSSKPKPKPELDNNLMVNFVPRLTTPVPPYLPLETTPITTTNNNNRVMRKKFNHNKHNYHNSDSFDNMIYVKTTVEETTELPLNDRPSGGGGGESLVKKLREKIKQEASTKIASAAAAAPTSVVCLGWGRLALILGWLAARLVVR